MGSERLTSYSNLQCRFLAIVADVFGKADPYVVGTMLLGFSFSEQVLTALAALFLQEKTFENRA